MPRKVPTINLYPLSNYMVGQKGPLLEKDSSVKDRMERMAQLYKKTGMRRVVEGLLIAHHKAHPHILMLQIGNTYFKLPGGRLRVGEHEIDGLRRKLTNKLGTPNENASIKWKIGELIAVWWRPNFETVMYPYIPPAVSKPKESRKIFLCELPQNGILGVPKNLKLLAVPLFELYDNAHRYGPVIASIPQLLARVKFVFKDRMGNIMKNKHIAALSLNNIQVYDNIHNPKKDDDEEDRKEAIIPAVVGNIGIQNNILQNNVMIKNIGNNTSDLIKVKKERMDLDAKTQGNMNTNQNIKFQPINPNIQSINMGNIQNNGMKMNPNMIPNMNPTVNPTMNANINPNMNPNNIQIQQHLQMQRQLQMQRLQLLNRQNQSQLSNPNLMIPQTMQNQNMLMPRLNIRILPNIVKNNNNNNNSNPNSINNNINQQ